ncbi:MAG TPA: DNA adenine methylase [Fimbriiglobus sp.]|nr:DNA adenine methylase [Fimbriiglobus sp.]
MIPALTPPLKWHGGKHYLARRIVALMPPHKHYVEPFAGGLSVLLAKNPGGVSEVVNDRDRALTNFWRVLQDADQFDQFSRMVDAAPFSETEWRDAGGRLDDTDPVVAAVAFFVRCRQSLAGRMDTFAPLSRRRVRRGMNEQASAWLSAVDGLPAVHARLRRVVILNRDALGVIRQEDGPATLFYLDPPYLPDTRAAATVYRCEMSAGDHRELLATIRDRAGRVMLSGYPSDLYERELSGWVRHDFELPNNAAGGNSKRRMTESVWCNFVPPEGGPR